MSINEKSVLEETLEIHNSRLVKLEEHKTLLVFSCKSTASVEKEIKECKSTIKDLEQKISKL